LKISIKTWWIYRVTEKDQITSAKAEGFKSGLAWAIDSMKMLENKLTLNEYDMANINDFVVFIYKGGRKVKGKILFIDKKL